MFDFWQFETGLIQMPCSTCSTFFKTTILSTSNFINFMYETDVVYLDQHLVNMHPKPQLKYAFSTFVDKNKKVKKRKCKKVEAKKSFLSLHPNTGWGFSGDKTLDQAFGWKLKKKIYKFASTFSFAFLREKC